ncbi:hypothetical protein WMF31_24060 [Sorangium sp. So ce1036]|uniref:hypothetical protein n=1 Tax=Sorangium sp. So ce1036 TaxID=3133328 RepID=UPI003F003A36
MTHTLRIALAALALACGGCSPPDEIVVAVPTDLKLPEDIDTLQIQVFEGSTSRFSAAYERLGAPDAAARLPLTLGFYSTTGGGDSIRIQVAGRAGGARGAVRILREAVTKIPQDRVALLTMPLYFLCDGSGRDDGNGGVVNRVCGEGQTCVAGRCAPSAVDASALPDYSAKAVYGGGSGFGGGDCFDVTACFDGAAPAGVDAAACSIEADGEPNVALRTEGDGICGDDGCLVALDAGSPDGFQTEDGRVRLPPAVCDQLASGKVTGVVTAPVTAECPQKSVGLPTCGPWSASGSEAP